MYNINSPLDNAVNSTYRTLHELKAAHPTWFAYYRTKKTITGLKLLNGNDELIAEIVKI